MTSVLYRHMHANFHNTSNKFSYHIINNWIVVLSLVLNHKRRKNRHDASIVDEFQWLIINKTIYTIPKEGYTWAYSKPKQVMDCLTNHTIHHKWTFTYRLWNIIHLDAIPLEPHLFNQWFQIYTHVSNLILSSHNKRQHQCSFCIAMQGGMT